ncbi:uncharacterized protein LOC136039416 isoform X2 [Artemia franciscana]|uniref:ALMS motif domain-containing protein n=1 Tax=Artemia franciscana TaxID=6661 RepID=A0AA88I789_ARTSF|nr:hypothetical protein QYM36_006881 [Artemia franciscana]
MANNAHTEEDEKSPSNLNHESETNLGDLEERGHNRFLSVRTLTSVILGDSDVASVSSMSFGLEDSHNDSEYSATEEQGNLSPTCASQLSTGSKRLEWDSAADVGYQGENPNSTSLTAIEKLALGCASKSYNEKEKLKRLPKSKAIVDYSTDEDSTKPSLILDRLPSESTDSAFVSSSRKYDLFAKMPKASSLCELRSEIGGSLSRSVSVGSGVRGHIENFLRKHGESSFGSTTTLIANGTPQHILSETNSEQESIKTQLTIMPKANTHDSSHSSSGHRASTSTSSGFGLSKRRKRKTKRSSDQTLDDRTRSFEYLPGHAYQSKNPSHESLNSSIKSQREKVDFQSIANQLVSSDFVNALALALQQKLNIQSELVLNEPSCSKEPDRPRDCTLTRPIPVEKTDSMFETKKHRLSEMATSSFEYRKVRKSRRNCTSTESSNINHDDYVFNHNRQQEGYSSGSVFSGGRGSSSLPSYAATTGHSEIPEDSNQQSQGESLVMDQEVSNQLQACKQLSKHLKGLKEYIGQLERTWRILAPPEALTPNLASSSSPPCRVETCSTPTTLSQSVTLSIAPTTPSEETMASNVLLRHPPKLIREYASVSIDCHLDKIRSKMASTGGQQHFGYRKGIQEPFKSAFARGYDGEKRGSFSRTRKPPAEAFFFPLNRNSVIKLSRDLNESRHSTSSSKNTRSRTAGLKSAQKDEKRVPTLQESLKKRRPDFISRSEYRQKILHEAQEMRIIKSSERRDRLVSLTSNLGSHETDKPPFSEANILAVPKMKVPFTSPIGSQRMFTHKEMREQTEKMFRRLPEAQKRALEKAREDAARANRLMVQLYQKRLQERALKGRINLAHHQSILTG